MMPFLGVVVYALRHTRGSGQRSEQLEGDRVSEEPKGLGASGDIIGALSARVSELTKRVGSLESELDSARKRVAVYEEFDATVRDALSGALRAAHQIRARAENAAQQILEQARDERKMLIKEIERLREERDGLVDEIASNRRSGFSALRGPRRESAAAAEKTIEETTSDSRALAADALRGVFTALLEDIRRQASTVADAAREANAAAAQAKTAQEQARVAQDEARSAQEEARRALETQRAAEAERSVEAARVAEQAQRATEEAARAADEARKVAEAHRLAQQQADLDRSVEAERAAEAARAAQDARRSADEARATEAARLEQQRREEEEKRAARWREEEQRRATQWREEEERRDQQRRIEDERLAAKRREDEARRVGEARLAAEEVRRAATAEALRIAEAARVAETAARAAQEAARAAEAARAVQPPVETPSAGPELTLVERQPAPAVTESEQVTPEREESAAPTSNIVLMLSPVPSFARLVDIERRIQSLAQVRTLYVRDFRGGVATLAVGLRVPMQVDELWSAIATLEQPRFALQRSGGTSLELRIEGEAGAGVA